MKLQSIIIGFVLLVASAAEASSVCVLTGNIFKARQSCDGSLYKDVSLTAALQSLLSNGYQIANVTALADGTGYLNYTLIK